MDIKPTQQPEPLRLHFSSFEQKDEAVTELTGNWQQHKLARFQLIARISNSSCMRNPPYLRHRKAAHGVPSCYVTCLLSQRGPPASQNPLKPH